MGRMKISFLLVGFLKINKMLTYKVNRSIYFFHSNESMWYLKRLSQYRSHPEISLIFATKLLCNSNELFCLGWDRVIFFIVAGTGLCFGFVLKTAVITQGYSHYR